MKAVHHINHLLHQTSASRYLTEQLYTALLVKGTWATSLGEEPCGFLEKAPLSSVPLGSLFFPRWDSLILGFSWLLVRKMCKMFNVMNMLTALLASIMVCSFSCSFNFNVGIGLWCHGTHFFLSLAHYAYLHLLTYPPR